ncbi:unnamed protein product [Calicophoron daubneyi]|uniref:Ig-like domain-containing protein n=1 Tax=Calicophoron daubneyi TaxID=300641 RepID=A0AAV2T7T2_CALDB
MRRFMLVHRMNRKILTTFLLLGVLICTSESQRVQVVYEGQNIAFVCNATGITGASPIHYQWELDNRVIIASDAYFSLRNVKKSDEGEYKCTATQFVNDTPVVAVESTFISVRKADSIVTQELEEGISVLLQCKVTGGELPEGAGPLRYEWRNPNGTLVGNEWELKLGQIEMHESGVYVCRVSYEVDKRQMSTSSATRINVIKRAGITFPGLRGNLLEVLETGDILQECVVKSEKPTNYEYQWIGPSGQVVSNTPLLRRSYVLRPQDEGIYTCRATPVSNGRLPVESELIVTIAPLRFGISTLDEDIKVGGFTHRRITIIPPTDPKLTTRETFTFQWIRPDGTLLSTGHGPDMEVTLDNPEDFGRYYIQVRGTNSNYQRDIMDYITLEDGIVEPTYSVVIREVSGPLYFNTRLELECSPKPPNPAARINWLGPDGTVVSDSSNLVFDKFLYHHQGRYTCQILLPNQVILRQASLSVELIASGSNPEAPDTGGVYTIEIVQSPLWFRYNDPVRLRCIVRPDPPRVDFEWLKDGQIIGRQNELFIPNFSPTDVGRYQCVARIEGGTEMSSNATISPPPEQGSTELIMQPEVIHYPAFSPIQIECISQQPGLMPIAQFANGAPIESDNRFIVTRRDDRSLLITAPYGLSNVYNGYRIQCVLPGITTKETTVYITDICPSGESQCRNKQCIPISKLCDGHIDCQDGTDEGHDFCNAGLIMSPNYLVVRPLEPFSLHCHSRTPGRMPYARFVYSRINVENDPRFRVERPSQEVLVIRAPQGLTAEANNTRIECYFPEEGTRIAVINVVDQPCPADWFLCRTGSCIPRDRHCDGVQDCPDGTDEIGCVKQCYPPNIACPSGECITPAMRCDGRRDCRDGFDEEGCAAACPSPRFRCGSGECISPGLRCNGRADCRDASDEADCPKQCIPPRIQCPSGECIDLEKRCDGVQDCRDGFDEQGCPEKCLPPNFACPSGECIEPRMVCDRRRDCLDGSDEADCAAPCLAPNFLCSSGECIEPNQRCDGRRDCEDSSDEVGCFLGPGIRPDRPTVRPYGTTEIECEAMKPGVRPQLTLSNGTSVEQLPRFQVRRPRTEIVIARLTDVTERDRGIRLRCTYPSGESVEYELVIESPCGPAEMMCRDGTCRPVEQFCNRRNDCPDGSDEQPPHCYPRCQADQFECQSGECVSSVLRCNGRQDCYDGSDEVGCYTGPTIFPGRPVIQPYGTMEIRCSSGKPNLRPQLVLENGTSVEQLPRFEISRPNTETIVARISELTERDRDLRLRCSVPTGESSETVIVIQSPCGPSELSCRDGTCLPYARFCDGRVDCSDGSDEMPPHCYRRPERRCRPDQFECSSGECISAGLRCNRRRDCYDGSDERGCSAPIVEPTRITVQPYGEVRIVCRSASPGQSPQLRFSNGTAVDGLPRVYVSRPDTETIVARITDITERDRDLRLICSAPMAQSTETIIMVRSRCSPSDMMCRDGTCVDAQKFCDRRKDCPDGSDEMPPHCYPRCSPQQFECSSGECIDSSLRCNGQQECYDGSDERGCAPRCGPLEFQCADGGCISNRLRCDNRPDCRDGSDEHGCIVPRFRPDKPIGRPYGVIDLECISNQPGVQPQLRLPNGTLLEELPRFLVSRPSTQVVAVRISGLTERDSGLRVQCFYPTGERIDSEITIESPCPRSQMMCQDGSCIDRSMFCDGQIDCPDGSDERPPHCVVLPPTIQPRQPVARPYGNIQLECRSNQLGIRPILQLANGTSVEVLPRFRVTRPSLQIILARIGDLTEADDGLVFRCVYRTGEFGEARLTIDTPCSPHELMCRDGTCIPREHFCNQRQDCPDGSDEAPPRCHARCLPGQFTCTSGECIDHGQRCDGRRDCFDGSDEAGCRPVCQPHEFPCVSGGCVDTQRRCDGRRDCADGSDEVGCAPVIRPIIHPYRPRVRPYESVEIECSSTKGGIRPELRLINGTTPERLQRFIVTRPSEGVIRARITHLTERDRGLIIRCYFPSGESQDSEIIIDSPCGPGSMMCRSGECIPTEQFCNGFKDCPDGSDEKSPHCHESTQVEMRPGRIHTQPYRPFDLECISYNVNIVPTATFADGRPVSQDPRFHVTQLIRNHIRVRAINGVSEREDNLKIMCVFPGVGNQTAVINVETACPSGLYQCHDGTCLPAYLFCNGHPDCPDESDEGNIYCGVGVRITPGVIEVKPYEAFRFECIVDVNGSSPQVFFDGHPVEGDPRFIVIRPTKEHVIVSVPHGVPDRGGHIFKCVSVTGSRKESVVRVQTTCPPGQYRCPGGKCIPLSAFCDGRFDCPDRSDEDKAYCAGSSIMTPGYIYADQYTPIEFVCDSRIRGVQPMVRFLDGRPIESDSRFTVTRPSTERVIVRAELGLTQRDQDTRLLCYLTSGTSQELLVQVKETCPPGQYRCRDGTCLPKERFCDGHPDCPDGTDEDKSYCNVYLHVTPGVIDVKPSQSFTFECRSVIPGVSPQVFYDGYPIEGNPLFIVQRPTVEHVVVRADQGIARSGTHRLKCMVVFGTSKEVEVRIQHGCAPGQFRCGDGTCIPSQAVCDRKFDCPDDSDERPPACPEPSITVRVHFTPGEIRIQPRHRVKLECRTDRAGARPEVRFVDGRPISADPRFVVSRPAPETVIIEVPDGFPISTPRITLECISPSGDRKIATIFVDQSCQPGQRRCPGADCIYAGQFCDGKVDCPDGFDERPENCGTCDPIAKPCELVDGRAPSISHYQIHWRCDGEDDCGNGFDELHCTNNTRSLDPQCSSTHFRCSSAPYQAIPYAYWCDGTPDCSGNEDETDCGKPEIIEVGRPEPYKIRPGETLTLECETAGVPPPFIVWRFNWGCLPGGDRVRTEAIQSRLGCRGSRSRLTIQEFRAGDDGIYNCEALVSNKRAMSQDVIVLLEP